MSSTSPKFVPALGHDWLTPFYDLLASLTGERAFKSALIAAARIQPGHDVLDIGCGTGTLALMLHEAEPNARIRGVDIDPKILEIAHHKIERANATAEIVQGSATDPPFPPASFDRIVSTLMIHHLTTEQKRQTFASALRLLRPGGQFHIADFGKPHNLLMQIASLGFRWTDGGEGTGANLRGELPSMLREAGFVDVGEATPWMTPFGTLTFLQAKAPAVG